MVYHRRASVGVCVLREAWAGALAAIICADPVWQSRDDDIMTIDWNCFGSPDKVFD